jgi:hypothetical protein
VTDAAAPTHEEEPGLLVLFRAKLCRLVGIEAERFLQHLDRLFHALELFASTWKIQCLAPRSKIAWEISWNRSFRQFSNVLAGNGPGADTHQMRSATRSVGWSCT